MLVIITVITLIFLYNVPKVSRPSPTTNSIKLPRLQEPQHVDQNVGPDKDVAEEYTGDEDDEDDEESDVKDDGGDSNLAEEEQTGNEGGDPVKVLPPRDASIRFSGPQNERQRAVVAAFQHAWQGYRTYAWGKDHLKPITKTHQTWFGLGLTLIDSLDTMLVMNLKEEFNEAKQWVEQELNFNVNKDVNLFETTIRVLGGLLSTFHLSGEKVFLDKARDLAGREL